jgi:hypothetical protein
MNTLRIVVTLRYLFTTTGVVAILLLTLYPAWEVRLVGGQMMHPRAWIWQQPDLSLVTSASSTVDWGATIGPAIWIAICTYAWWRIGGRDLQRLKVSTTAVAADEPEAASR